MANPRHTLRLETLETRDLLSASPLGDLVGVVRDGRDLYLAGDHSGSIAAQVRAFGQPGDRILSGDWNGDGKTDLIAVRANAGGGLTWDIDTDGDGKADVQHKYGLAGDIAFVGDWNGDGKLNLGVARRNYQSGGLDWYLDTTRLDYASPPARQFGLVNDTPVVGDWDGNGTTDVGVTRPDAAAGLLQWNLDTSGDAWPEVVRDYGLLGTHDVPVTGDWNGDGKTDLGVTRDEAGMKRWYLDTNGDAFADVTQTFGFANDTPVVGPWQTLAPPVVAPPVVAPPVVRPPVVRPPAIPTEPSTPPSHPTLPDLSEVSRTGPFKSFVVVHVTDSNNVSVPGATVTLTGAGGKTLTGTTDDRGVVKFPDLPEGTYHATASKDGVGAGVGNIDPKLEQGEGPGYPVVKLVAHPTPQGELSGAQWVSRYPGSSSTSTLAQPFRGNVERFIAALRAAGASVDIAATLRPPQRAYLMYYAYRIAREGLDPRSVPAFPGVNIRWAHTNSSGQFDLAASRRAAEAMVQGYGIVHAPVLTSRHTEGLAIDMNISWSGNLVIRTGRGQLVTITSTPRTGAGNAALYQVGATYGVIKLISDAPHWSSDGH